MTAPAEWKRAVSLLAIDPGNVTGWCLLLDVGGWHIAGAGVCKPHEEDGIPIQKRVDLLVIENPQIYPNSPVPPNDILTLARSVGRYEERFAHRAQRKMLVRPREWKGSVDGDVMVRRIEAGLSPQDKATLAHVKVPTSYRHNILDSIGMAYWATRQPWIREPRKVT